MTGQPDRRRLEGLVQRFAAEDRLRGTRRDARAVPTTDVASIEVTGVTHDSRQVRPGMLFVAIPGQGADGHDFVPAAVAAGAAGVIVERPGRRGSVVGRHRPVNRDTREATRPSA